MKKVLKIKNLDCPFCGQELQDELQKIEGVDGVTVDYVTQTVTLETEREETLQKVIYTVNHFEKVRVIEEEKDEEEKEGSHFKDWFRLLLSTAFFLLGILFQYAIGKQWAEICAYVAYGLAYVTVGYPVLLSTAKNLIKGRIFDENFLMTIASIGAVVLGEYMEAVLVMLLYQLGELLQEIAVGSSRRSLTKLMEMKSEWATVLENGTQKQVRPEDVRVGDILLVKAGEKVPADGVLLGEKAVLDTKSLTGEAELKTVACGEEILSGCINAGGMYEMKVIRPYQDSAVGRILDMVENASAGKAKPEKFITKFARYYTPIVCLLAAVVAFVVPLVSGLAIDGRWYFKDFASWVEVALVFLVVSCPCALIISVPLTYFSGIGTCAKYGILVKGATYLDLAAKAKTVAFDKTGTLTEGNFSVCGVKATQGTDEELLQLVAAVERGSSHPIAKAFANITTPYTAESVEEKAGRGLLAAVEGKTVLVGNGTLMKENGIKYAEPETLYTLVYVAREGEYLGYVEVGDKIRGNAAETVKALKELGLSRSVMLTGDSEKRAYKVANAVGVCEVNAGLLPDEKLIRAKELKEEGGLIYVGDGINDAPVMMTADCSVSMGKLGSAAAVEASDFVLIQDDLSALPKTVKISRKTRSIVLQNIVFSIVMKAAFMALGFFGLPLWLAVFADVGVMLLAVLNSFRVRKLKK